VNRVFKLAAVLALTLLIFHPIAAISAPITSKTSKTSVAISPLETPINELILLLKGKIAPKDYFDPTFLNAVPEAQFLKISKDIIAQYGQPIRILNIDKKSQESAIVTIEFESAFGTVNLNIVRTPPFAKVNGLLFTGFTAKNDSLAKIDASFAALPGKAGYIIELLDDAGRGRTLSARKPNEQFAIGSTFKLYILAELASQIDGRERKWGDVVPLSHRSFSSPATSKWPKDSPATLQTLALQMISVSDNSATDTLLHTLGRSAVERKLALIGHSAPDKTLPFLSTVEAFAMKAPANKDLRDRFLKANEADQRRIIDTQHTRLGLAQVDNSAFGNGPAFIDTLEWFASPSDIANVMNHIRNSRNDRMLQILSVNPGIPAADVARWNYVGYKGGSETGVISMSYLLQSKSGVWYVVSGSWNNPAKEVDQKAFAALMIRLVQSVK
jgi:beta-lactamase class A